VEEGGDGPLFARARAPVATAAAPALAPKPVRRVVRVAELVARLRIGLQETFPSRFWLEGEVSGYKVARSGHAFFVLKEENACVEAVVWQDRLIRLPFTPEEGTSVLALVSRVDFFAPAGRLRLHVEQLEPVGVGALARALEERKARLRAEGLFDEARKRPLPLLPVRIGIATASPSAALRDILKTLEQRYADRHLLVRPCRVQGQGAAEDIAAAIDDLNRDGRADVILVGRGGGSAEDLWCFNEEVVVRAIARSTIPVVAGIGHEVDWTLADLVADLRVATPTAAAQRCLPERLHLERQLDELARRLGGGLVRRVDLARARVRACVPALADPRSVVTVRTHRLEVLATRAREALGQLTPARRARLERAGARLRGGLPRTDVRAAALERAGARLQAAFRASLEQARRELGASAARVEALSPLGVLSRGFAVVRDEGGAIVRDAATVAAGDELSIRFARGAARARVLSTESTDDAVPAAPRPPERD